MNASNSIFDIMERRQTEKPLEQQLLSVPEHRHRAALAVARDP